MRRCTNHGHASGDLIREQQRPPKIPEKHKFENGTQVNDCNRIACINTESYLNTTVCQDEVKPGNTIESNFTNSECPGFLKISTDFQVQNVVVPLNTRVPAQTRQNSRVHRKPPVGHPPQPPSNTFCTNPVGNVGQRIVKEL